GISLLLPPKDDDRDRTRPSNLPERVRITSIECLNDVGPRFHSYPGILHNDSAIDLVLLYLFTRNWIHFGDDRNTSLEAGRRGVPKPEYVRLFVARSNQYENLDSYSTKPDCMFDCLLYVLRGRN